MTPDPISAAHVTGTLLKTDSGMLTQTEARPESMFPECKAFWLSATSVSDTESAVYSCRYKRKQKRTKTEHRLHVHNSMIYFVLQHETFHIKLTLLF